MDAETKRKERTNLDDLIVLTNRRSRYTGIPHWNETITKMPVCFFALFLAYVSQDD